MDVFAAKLAELRARRGGLTELEQDALDTEDAEVLVRLCPEEVAPPVKKVKKSATSSTKD